MGGGSWSRRKTMVGRVMARREDHGGRVMAKEEDRGGRVMARKETMRGGSWPERKMINKSFMKLIVTLMEE